MSSVAGVLVVVGLLGAAGVAAGASSGGVGLPDGRAWEMVSPLEKNGGFVSGIERDINGGGVVQAAASGDAITYVSPKSFGSSQGAPIGSQYVAARGPAEGWLTHDITTPMSDQAYVLGGSGTPYRAFSSDLSSGLVFGGNRRGQGIPVESPPLTPGAPAGYEDYYLYGIPGGALRSLLTEPPGVSAGEFGLEFLGATPDLSHVVLRSRAALAGDAVEGNGVTNALNLYDWEAATGRFQTVNIPPGSTTSEPEAVMYLGDGEATERAISDDGSRVVWRNGTHTYVRMGIGTGHAATVQVDAPAGEGHFLAASSDDAKIFFIDHNKLTGDASGAGEDLYLFEPEGGPLVDLTVDNVDPGGAEVLGVLGASADGSSLYFVANGRLAAGAPQGNCAKERGVSPPGARCNLYLWHQGWKKPRFIAALSALDEGFGVQGSVYPELGIAFDWDRSVGQRTARVSRDGMRVVFMSEETEALVGYDNTVATGNSCGTTLSGVRLPAKCQEVFLYEASGSEAAPGRLSCVSCNSSGARPAGPSGIPGGTTFRQSTALYQSRVLSEGEGVGSRVFFDSADALVSQDTNGAEDVYEYENGRVFLLSDGKSARGASFVDASTSGNDVFFTTRAQLAGQDTDQLVDLYDARAPHGVGERVGFPVSPAVACEGEGCRPAGPTAPLFTALSSASFSGPGNVAVTPAAVVAKPKPKARVKRKRKRRPVRRGKRAGRRSGRAGRGVR